MVVWWGKLPTLAGGSPVMIFDDNAPSGLAAPLVPIFQHTPSHRRQDRAAAMKNRLMLLYEPVKHLSLCFLYGAVLGVGYHRAHRRVMLCYATTLASAPPVNVLFSCSLSAVLVLFSCCLLPHWHQLSSTWYFLRDRHLSTIEDILQPATIRHYCYLAPVYLLVQQSALAVYFFAFCKKYKPNR